MDIKQFLNKNGKINSFYCQAGFLEKKGLLSLVLEQTKFLNEEYSLTERVTCLVNNITEAPVCVVCKNKTKINLDYNPKFVFRQTCSPKCNGQLPKDFSKVDQKAAAVKRAASMKEKYGYEYNNQRPIIREKISKGVKMRIGKKAFDHLNDEAWLNEEYNNKKRTGIEIAKELGCDYATVLVYARKYGFYIRQHVNISIFEKEIQEFLTLNNINFIASTKDIIKPLELDIYLPDYNIAIEFNGVYWHSEDGSKPTNSNRHLKKTEACEALNIQLLHINEQEWIEKGAIWKSIILNKCNKSKRIFARHTIVKDVSNTEAKLFLNVNHLQGEINGKHLGLFYQDELVQIITYGTNRFKKGSTELLRSCSKLNTNIVGGFSKLLAHLPADVYPLTSYCNRRYSQGKGYVKSGFTLSHITKPSYAWIMKDKIINRMSCQKHKLHNLLKDFDLKLSEADNMFNNGYRRLWDCGNLVYTITK